ncbi:MAG: FkbM family methyltransferase [Gammaproteobacteria bacterium]|nr:FkbM family methyltransferase [Gammaproteobacteria bacterium]
MRTSGWMKRQPWFWPIKLFLKRISGKELWLRRDFEMTTTKIGEWAFVPELLHGGSIVYSLGVGDSVEFDLGVIERYGSTVYAFDPTPYAMEWVAAQTLPTEFVFKPWAASGADGSLRLYRRVSRRGKRAKVMWTADAGAGDIEDHIDAPAYTIATIMQQLEHEKIDLLKMDVEGAEYDVLDGLKNVQNLPKQLLVEFHHRFRSIGKQKTATAIEKLRGLGYQIFWLSETGREIGFMQVTRDSDDA